MDLLQAPRALRYILALTFSFQLTARGITERRGGVKTRKNAKTPRRNTN